MTSAGRATTDTAVAALDCGTNSTRLLVADREGRPLERLVRITRLGQGVDATGRLAPEAIARTTQALKSYRAVMEDRGVGPGNARLVATSAVRDAANPQELTAAAEAATGVVAEVLSGEQEGQLCYAGATGDLDPAGGPFLVLDIGGGSTELITPPERAGDAVVSVVSLDLGCVRLTERFLGHDPPSPDELGRAQTAIHRQLSDARRALPELEEAACLVGVAGTVTTLAAMQQRLVTYDRDAVHHWVLTRSGVEELLGAMAAQPSGERALRPGLEEARADVIVAGSLILATVMGDLGFESCVVSEADILDGLVMSQLAAGSFPSRPRR